MSFDTKNSSNSQINNIPAIFSFFSGSGLLDYGFEQAGFNIVFVNEFEEQFLNAYIYVRNRLGLSAPAYGHHNTDITDYLGVRKKELDNYIENAKQDNSLFGFIGGPPCPDFSVAGKNKGKHGENGILSLTYIDVFGKLVFPRVEIKNSPPPGPDYCILE